MSDLSVTWEADALDLLDSRDRYTRQAIREQFNPNVPAIQFDPDDADSFLTLVSDNRFSVVWRKDGDKAIVRAVVPLPSVAADAGPSEQLKAYVQRAVKAESNGKILI
jgi:hypothetical protein